MARRHRGRRSNILAPISGPAIQHLANQLLQPQQQQIKNAALAQMGLGRQVAKAYEGVAPAISQAYQDAGQTTIDAAAGFSGALRDTLSGQNADIQAMLDKVGAGGFTAPDAGAAADALYGTAGYIPGTGLAREGAASAAAAAQLPASQLGAAALQAANLRRQGMQSLAEQRAQLLPQLMNLAIQQEAQNLYGQQFQHQKLQDKRQYKLAVAGLKLDQAREARYLRQQIQDGLQIDAAASNVLGYVVDHNGNPVLKNGHKIKVKGGGDAKKAYQYAVDKASDLRGSPIKNTNQGPLAPGMYIAAPGATGVFPAKGGFPATTNNPDKAKWDGEKSFHEALRFLQNRYGISRKKARKALIAAGWPPPPGKPGHVGESQLPHD